VTERAALIARVRKLAIRVAAAWLEQTSGTVPDAAKVVA
jgi:glycyl-tRNA synthetase alpha subunit